MQRIRKITELQIAKDKLDYLQRIMSGKYLTDKTKHNIIKRIIEYSPCCMCGGIPKFQVIYKERGAQRIECYCGGGCLEALSKREEQEPKNKDPYEIAEYYGCSKGQVPHSKPTF
jgi:hypothetical protein